MFAVPLRQLGPAFHTCENLVRAALLSTFTSHVALFSKSTRFGDVAATQLEPRMVPWSVSNISNLRIVQFMFETKPLSNLNAISQNYFPVLAFDQIIPSTTAAIEKWSLVSWRPMSFKWTYIHVGLPSGAFYAPSVYFRYQL